MTLYFDSGCWRIFRSATIRQPHHPPLPRTRSPSLHDTLESRPINSVPSRFAGTSCSLIQDKQASQSTRIQLVSARCGSCMHTHADAEP